MAFFERIKLAWGSGSTNNDVTEANPLPTRDDDNRNMSRGILQMLMAPLGYDKSLQRYRQTAVVESGTITTVTTVTTCSTVTNLSQIDTLQGRIQVYGANYSAWSDCVRARIT